MRSTEDTAIETLMEQLILNGVQDMALNRPGIRPSVRSGHAN